MKSKTFIDALAAFAILVTAVVGGLAGPTTVPDLRDLILEPAQSSYSGRLRFVHWNGVERLVEEAQVYFDPPNRYLEEFVGPDGSTKRLAVSDGQHDEVYILKDGRLAARSLAMSAGPVRDQESRWRMLVRNYRMRVKGTREAAGRKAWIVELRPRVAGKPWQTLLVDEQTGIILLNRRYLPGTEYSSSLSFATFQTGKPDPSIFEVEGQLAPATGSAFLNRPMDTESLSDRRPLGFPERLPDGFVLEGESGFRVGGNAWVRQARYSDGLAFLSVFQTDRPIAMPRRGFPSAPTALAAADELSLVNFTTTLQLTRGQRHYLLVSDVSSDLLSVVARALPD